MGGNGFVEFHYGTGTRRQPGSLMGHGEAHNNVHGLWNSFHGPAARPLLF